MEDDQHTGAHTWVIVHAVYLFMMYVQLNPMCIAVFPFGNNKYVTLAL
jgi:hypothetical protein